MKQTILFSLRDAFKKKIAQKVTFIVTLLRLAALNEEIRENDMTVDDDTFNDVVQEFSQMVYTHPERLQKKGDKTK